MSRNLLLSGAVLASVLLGTAHAHALEIREDDNHYLDFRGFVQPRLSLAIDGDDNSVAQDFYVRRVRLFFSGKVHENIGFLVGTLTPDIGRMDG